MKKYMKPEMEILDAMIDQQLLAGSDIAFGSGDVDPSTADAPGMNEYEW